MATVPAEITVSDPPQKKVLIIGGGFAGLEACRYFKGSKFAYALMEKKEFHEFTPDVPETITTTSLTSKVSKDCGTKVYEINALPHKLINNVFILTRLASLAADLEAILKVQGRGSLRLCEGHC